MKRSPLRAAYVGATLATSIVLLTGEPALAHVDVRPRLVEVGRVTDLLVELPQLRTGAPVELEVEGDGIEVLSTRRRSVLGTETRWTVRVRPAGPPGSVRLILRVVYEDGESVPVEDTLTVVPAPEASAFPWLAVVAGALLATAVAAMTLVLARRKP